MGRSMSNNDLWDMINRSPQQRRLFDSRDPADALLTWENQILGKSRTHSTALHAKIHDSGELARTVSSKEPYRLTEWLYGHQNRIDHKMTPTKFRNMNIQDEPHEGYWPADWSPQGRLDARARSRSAVVDTRVRTQSTLEEEELDRHKVVKPHGCGGPFANSRKPISEEAVSDMVHRNDQLVRSGPHQKIVRFYHIGSTMPHLR